MKVENEILDQAKKGDEMAFKELVLSIKNDLYRIAKSRLNNEEDVKDVLQNTMLIVFRKIKHLKNIDAFKTWIIKILINECNKSYNKNKKDNEIVEKELIKATNSINVDYYIDDTNDEVTFYNKLKILNEKEQNIIVMFYGNKYSCPEISKILHMNENTVRSNLRRAKKKLEKLYLKGL